MKELYRICVNEAVLEIAVPHPFHDDFVSDPTHVRPITRMTLALFDKEQNLNWRKMGAANSPLALQFGVDFRILEARNMIDPNVHQKLLQLKQRDSLLADMLLNHGRNIIKACYFKSKVVK